MKTNVSTLLPLAVVALLPLLPAAASAQTGGNRAPVHPATTSIVFEDIGAFKSTDGTSGTFKQTESFLNLGASSTVTTIYTRKSDNVTRTEAVSSQTNADGTLARSTTITDYGATASFTSSQTITPLGRGQSVGRGTYLTADGVSGTLTSVEIASAGGVDSVTTVYNSPTGGVSTEQRTQTNASGQVIDHHAASIAGGGQIGFTTSSGVGMDSGSAPLSSIATKAVIKTVSVDAGGNATSSVQTRTLDETVSPLTP